MKLYLKWAWQALASTVIDVISRLFINRLLTLWCDADGNLKLGRKWWQTFDNNCYEGQRCRERDIVNKSDSDTWREFIAFPLTWWHKYLNRKNWLQRNSCYGIEYYLFGIDWVKADWSITTYINTPEKILFIARSTTGHFNLYYHGRWGMYKFGWKAWNMHQDIDGVASFHAGNGMGGLGKIPLTFSPNPFKTRKST